MNGVSALPRLSLRLDGREAPEALARCLGTARLQQRLSLPAQCELAFFEPPPDALRRHPCLPGTALTLALEGVRAPLFEGEVTAAERHYAGDGGGVLRLRAYDALQRLRLRQPVRVHRQLSCAELARELVADLGLQLDEREPGPLWQYLVQHEQTDFDLLAEVAARSGLFFTLRGDRLTLLSLAPGDPDIELALGRNLHQARFELNAAAASEAVRTLAWDPWYAEARAAESQSARNRGEVPPPGPAATRRTLTGRTAQNEEQAAAAAQDELDRRTALGRSLWAVAAGDARLRPGASVEVSGVDPAHAGRYLVTNATHTIDREHGYRTEFDTLPPAAPPPRPTANTTLGRVTDVEDPQRLGRVRVALPGYGDLESEWLEVLLPAAGADKGLVALPDLDDRVLVQFVSGDPAQAVVLGGLYGPQSPPETGVVDGGIARYTLATRDGQRVQLDDTEHALRLETRRNSDLHLAPGRARLHNNGGSYVELNGKRVVVRAAEHLVLEAPGGQVTIRGGAIDFEQG